MRRRRRLAAVAAVLTLVGVIVAAVGGGDDGHPVFFGLALPSADLGRLPAFEAASGCRPSVFAQFVKLDSPSFTAAALEDISAAGMIPFLTLEPWSFRSPLHQPEQPEYALRTLIDGAHDAQLRAIAAVLARYGGPAYLRFAHEMNAGWYPWGQANGNTPAEYVAAWRHVHRLLAAADPAMSWVWSPVAVQQVRGGAPLASFYPGDDVVDFVGMTGYANGANGERSPAATFDPTLRALRTITAKPVILSEVGADGPGKAGWIAGLGRYLASRRDIRGFVYFNTSPASTGATGNYELSGDDLGLLRASLMAAGACTPAADAAGRPVAG